MLDTIEKILANKYLIHSTIIITTIILAVVCSSILRKVLNIFVKRYAEKLRADPTNFSFIKNSISFVIYSCAAFFIIYSIPALRSLGAALFAGAGVLAAIIGFASQKAFSNIISGIFILIFKPFRVEDVIELQDGLSGWVEEITLRHTVIKDFEYKRIVIPNSLISDQTIVNSTITDNKIRKKVEIGISYDSNIDKAIKIIQEEVVKHPNWVDGRDKDDLAKDIPEVVVRVVSLGDFSVVLRAYVWAGNYMDAFELQTDIYKSVKERFDQEGIEIPFPYRTVVFKKDLPKNV